MYYNHTYKPLSYVSPKCRNQNFIYIYCMEAASKELTYYYAICIISGKTVTNTTVHQGW